jgi:hypothetical protein
MRRMGIEKAIENLQPLIKAAKDPAEREALITEEAQLWLRLDPSRHMRLNDVRYCADCGKDYTYETIGGPRCRKCRNAFYQRKRKMLPPEEKRAIAYKAKGRPLTPEQFKAKVAAQGDGCAICGEMPPDRPAGRPRGDGTRAMTSGLMYDHDHATGMGRGLLCHTCNLMLGGARDDPALLEAAIAYLSEWKAAQDAHASEPQKSCVDFCTFGTDLSDATPWTALAQTQLLLA